MDRHMQQRALRDLHAHRRFRQHGTYHLHISADRPDRRHRDARRDLSDRPHQERNLGRHSDWPELGGLHRSVETRAVSISSPGNTGSQANTIRWTCNYRCFKCPQRKVGPVENRQ